MCGEGCIKKIKKIALEIPSKGGKKRRVFKAHLIEKSGERPFFAPMNNPQVKIDLQQFINKKGARIIEK